MLETRTWCMTVAVVVLIASAMPSVSAAQPLDLTWSFRGERSTPFCTNFREPAEPPADTWGDNVLCSATNVGLRFSANGPVPGLVCVAVNEPSDPDSWSDNFICSNRDLGLRWSFAGTSIPGTTCEPITEPSDPHTWNDNVLCAPNMPDFRVRAVTLTGGVPYVTVENNGAGGILTRVECANVSRSINRPLGPGEAVSVQGSGFPPTSTGCCAVGTDIAGRPETHVDNNCRPWPSDGTDVSVHVDRLQARSSDACGNMDFFSRIDLAGRPQDFRVREGNDIAPGWGVHRIVPSSGTVDAVISIRDDDDFFCGGGDDQVDVNPDPRDDRIRMRVNVATGQIALLDASMQPTGVLLGVAGEPFMVTGDHGAERATMTFRVGITR